MGDDLLVQPNKPMDPYPYRFLLRSPAVLVRLTGPFELARSLETLRALDRHPRRFVTAGLIWDARRRTSIPVSSDIERLLDFFTHWPRVAILSQPDAQYGMARMAELRSHDHVLACQGCEGAVDWVLHGRLPEESLGAFWKEAGE